MENKQDYDDEFIVNLTIDGSPYEEVEVKVTDPQKQYAIRLRVLLPYSNCLNWIMGVIRFSIYWVNLWMTERIRFLSLKM